MGDEIDLQGHTGIYLSEKMYFRRSDRYNALWEPSQKGRKDVWELSVPVHASVYRIVYADEKYYVLAHIDQQPGTFDLLSCFEKIKPLVRKGLKSPRLEDRGGETTLAAATVVRLSTSL